MILDKIEITELKKELRNFLLSKESMQIILDIFKKEFITHPKSIKNFSISNSCFSIFQIEAILEKYFGEALKEINFYKEEICFSFVPNAEELVDIYNEKKFIKDYIFLNLNFYITLNETCYYIIFKYFWSKNDYKDYKDYKEEIICNIRKQKEIPDPAEIDTDYVTIKRNKKKGLFKFISGDRTVINSKHYIKKETVQSNNNEESIKVLFELNNDI